MRFLTDDDVRQLLPAPEACVDLAASALVALAEGRAEVPPKPAVHTVPGSFANAMPAAWPERGMLGCKWISIFPDNPSRKLPTSWSLVMVRRNLKCSRLRLFEATATMKPVGSSSM